MKNKTLLVLISAAGFKNYGDEKILLKWMSFYKIYKHLDYVLIHGMSHDLVVMYNDDPQIRYQFPVHTLDDDCLDKVLCLCDSYDLVIIHITGGGFMNDKFKGNHGISIFQQIFRFILGVRSKFKQTVLIGTGLSLYPLNIGSAKLIKKNDDFKFQYCSFRDEVTSYYFQANGSPLYGDDLLNVLFLPLERRSIKRRLLVNIQNQFEITAYIYSVAKKINQIAMNGNFDEIIVCELSPGDLDIAELIGFSHTRTISYEHMMSDLFYVNKGDLYIATRFHFRMLMENSGVRGIAIVIDDYYSNKHEVNAKNVNFHKNMSNVYSIETFISEDISLPTNGYKKNLPGRFFKKVEMYYLRFFCFV